MQVGVFGATGLVGQCLLPMLIQAGCRVHAFSRQAVPECSGNLKWQHLAIGPDSPAPLPETGAEIEIPFWICLAPLWTLPEYFDLMQRCGARRLIVLSSTSRFTKLDSADLAEHATIHRLIEAEARIENWAKRQKAEWIIFRPTLIYGCGWDKNISEIARFVSRFGFFPVFGKAKGLRQPVHARDVAQACVLGLNKTARTNHAYQLSGAEILTYREMLTRIFTALGKPLRLIPVPLLVFRITVSIMRLLSRYRHWSYAMATRMNQDMVFEHSEASHHLGFSPRRFELTDDDLPG